MPDLKFTYATYDSIKLVTPKLERIVTSISVDNWMQMVSFVVEKGTNVQVLRLTIDECISAGILNLDKLNGYYNK